MDTSIATILAGAGVAGVWVICFLVGLIYPKSVVTDLKTEITELKQALGAERDRADTAVAAASATRDVLAAIQYGRESGRERA